MQLWERFGRKANFELTEALFVRLLGLIYFSAFVSLWPQILGLIGAHGVTPANGFMAAMRSSFGPRAFFYAPSLLWLNSADGALLATCIFGCIASVLMAAGIFSRVATIVCFVLYLSLSSVGQPFTSFQWDALLLEAGFLAIFAGVSWLVWAYRLLLFRLMFESGWVKLASHDLNWRNLHALRFHFMTQPLPNPLAYYAYRLPSSWLDVMTGATLAIELVAPFLLFAPRLPRYVGVGLLMLLQLAILLTGNYAFFNLLTLALCLWAFDDNVFAPMGRLLRWRFPRSTFRLKAFTLTMRAAVVVMVVLSFFQLINATTTSALFSRPLALLQPLEIVNSYGLFAVMTTTRPEIILEGSDDQVNWREYQFPYKPGNTHRSLPWVAPYQPRLDWQMWFAALGDYQGNTWVGGLMYRLLTGEPAVYKLLSRPPFERPPRYMRAMLYQYNFTTPAERAQTGAVWRRQEQGIWFGPVSLKGQ